MEKAVSRVKQPFLFLNFSINEYASLMFCEM